MTLQIGYGVLFACVMAQGCGGGPETSPIVLGPLPGDTVVTSQSVMAFETELPIVVAFYGTSTENDEILADFQYHLRPRVRRSIADSGYSLVESYGPGFTLVVGEKQWSVSTALVEVGYLVMEDSGARLYSGVRTGIDLLTDLGAPTCAEAMTTFEMRGCYNAELAVAEAGLVSKLSEGVFASGGSNAAGEYREWRAVRDDECRVQAAEFEGGILAPVAFLICAAALTREHSSQIP